MDETIEKLNEILTSLSNITTSLSNMMLDLTAITNRVDRLDTNFNSTISNINSSLERIEKQISNIPSDNNTTDKTLLITSSERIIQVNEGEEFSIKISINGIVDNTCDIFIDNEFFTTIDNVENDSEIEVLKEIAENNKEITLYIESNSIKSNEIIFSIVVNNIIEEENFNISSTYTGITAYRGGKVNYALDINGLKTDGFRVYINGSYFKTVESIENTSNVIIYSEYATQDKILFIQLEDDENNFSNILEYTLTVVDPGYSFYKYEDNTIKTLIINSDDLERRIKIGDEVELRASVSGLEYDSLSIYVNDYYTETLENITDYDDILLYKFYPDIDIEVNIQIEDPNGKKSNNLKFCIHVYEDDVPPLEEVIDLIPVEQKDHVEYTKLIGGNRSTWTLGNNEIISDISKLNINSLTLSVRMNIHEYTSNTVNIDEDDLKLCKDLMINLKAQDLLNKMQIILEPCPCINNGEVNERYFNPTDPELFLRNWRNEVYKLVNEFSDYSFYGIYVNTNMDNLSEYTYLWQDIYDELKRARPDTNILIKTNWWIGNEDNEETGLQGFTTKCTSEYFKIWDIIAISAYFPLGSRQGEGTASASYKEICNLLKLGTIEYNQMVENDIKMFAEITGKPIMFGELGIPALLYGISFPESVNHTDVEDQNTQRNWYQAWHETFINYEWFLGWSFYHMADKYNSPYDPTERSAGLYIASIDAINKYKK